MEQEGKVKRTRLSNKVARESSLLDRKISTFRAARCRGVRGLGFHVPLTLTARPLVLNSMRIPPIRSDCSSATRHAGVGLPAPRISSMLPTEGITPWASERCSRVQESDLSTRAWRKLRAEGADKQDKLAKPVLVCWQWQEAKQKIAA